MPRFGKKSKAVVKTCSRNLQRIVHVAIQLMDFSALVGHRTPKKQFELFKKGRKLLDGEWVIEDRKKLVTKIDGFKKKGKHNYEPSQAIDIAPHPIDWSDKPKAIARFYLLAGVILTLAWLMGVKLRWGGDWDGDWDLSDQNFDDLGHFEEVT